MGSNETTHVTFMMMTGSQSSSRTRVAPTQEAGWSSGLVRVRAVYVSTPRA